MKGLLELMKPSKILKDSREWVLDCFMWSVDRFQNVRRWWNES